MGCGLGGLVPCVGVGFCRGMHVGSQRTTLKTVFPFHFYVGSGVTRPTQ